MADNNGSAAVLESPVKAEKIVPQEGQQSAPAEVKPKRGPTREDNIAFARTSAVLARRRVNLRDFAGECWDGVPGLTPAKIDEVTETFREHMVAASREWQEWSAVDPGVGGSVNGISLNKGLVRGMLGLGKDKAKDIKDAFKTFAAGLGVSFK